MEDIRVLIRDKRRKSLYMYYCCPLTGQEHCRSTGTSNRREAERTAAKWEAELREGRYAATTRITWEDYRQRYEDEKLTTLAPASLRSASTALNHLERVVRPRRLSDITTARLAEFSRMVRRDGMKETTLASHLGHIRAAMSWAVGQGLLAHMPRVDMPKRAKGVTKTMRGRPLTLEEFERMILATPKVRKRDAEKWQRLLTGLWLSGLRIGEALALSWDEGATVAVDTLGKYPAIRFQAEGQKAHRDELLALTPDFGQFLLDTPEGDRVGLVFNIVGAKSGVPMTTKRAIRYVSAIGKAAGVVVNKAEGKTATAHDLRRTFGTRWASRVMPAQLQRLMRHATVETTLKFYVALDADEQAAGLWRDFGGVRDTYRDTTRSTPSSSPQESDASLCGERT